MAVEQHPHLLARALRALRVFQHVPGWGGLLARATPRLRSGEFVVDNDGTLLAGNLESFIERELYFLGGYEAGHIKSFLDVIPKSRRGTILDVGANVGTHSLAFARAFEKVHAFEPNSGLWPSFDRNVALNRMSNVNLHKVGLGDRDGELPFYSIQNGNYGLGTFSDIEQYDQPLQETGTSMLRIGDTFLEEAGVRDVDAMKIDVQGFEPQALRGLAKTLARCRPVVWMEAGTGTLEEISTGDQVAALFPYPVQLFKMVPKERWTKGTRLVQVRTTGQLQSGNYVSIAD